MQKVKKVIFKKLKNLSKKKDVKINFKPLQYMRTKHVNF